ncbi:hypothetical protein L218DRAFT_949925 [Marasmius fiardii PR-910]|nr:hypothetical protein L218DRAFT_949925 [Marasmius fiardii PR-910]
MMCKVDWGYIPHNRDQRYENNNTEGLKFMTSFFVELGNNMNNLELMKGRNTTSRASEYKGWNSSSREAERLWIQSGFVGHALTQKGFGSRRQTKSRPKVPEEIAMWMTVLEVRTVKEHGVFRNGHDPNYGQMVFRVLEVAFHRARSWLPKSIPFFMRDHVLPHHIVPEYPMDHDNGMDLVRILFRRKPNNLFRKTEVSSFDQCGTDRGGRMPAVWLFGV